MRHRAPGDLQMRHFVLSGASAMVVSLLALAGSALGAPLLKPPQLVLQAPPTTSVSGVAVSPDGSLVAAISAEGGVRLHDARTGTLLRAIDEIGDRSVAFSPDGRYLAAAGFHMDKLVKLREVQTGKLSRTFAGHTKWETCAVAFSPDGKLLASAGRDR